MKQEDITKQIVALHEEDELNKIMDDVNAELRNGIPISLQQEINACLNKINDEEVTNSENVVSFKPKRKPSTNTFAETELLAASGQSLADWFSQPLSFGGAGFVLDIRKVIGSEDEVDLYLISNQADNSKMKQSLSSYLGKTLNICISNDGTNLLTAALYVDESGLEAEGSGHLNKVDGNFVKGKISIEVIIE
ncbi:hypothetical protein [Pseudoalteromonas sp. C8]|uniref:hypothetical protein n=1 Tax=Pseudoalteromonas sp. C8 TaxID=2686345 RepID=UPI0013FD6D15|nr:hypothetical protein [Pseudoalteromonas sp. C8]